VITKSWKDRLAAMDHSKGTTAKLRQTAMLAEIKDLRRLLQPAQIAWREAKMKQARTGKTEQRLQAELTEALARLRMQRWAVKQARIDRDDWRAAALKYQRAVLDKNKP